MKLDPDPNAAPPGAFEKPGCEWGYHDRLEVAEYVVAGVSKGNGDREDVVRAGQAELAKFVDRFGRSPVRKFTRRVHHALLRVTKCFLPQSSEFGRWFSSFSKTALLSGPRPKALNQAQSKWKEGDKEAVYRHFADKSGVNSRASRDPDPRSANWRIQISFLNWHLVKWRGGASRIDDDIPAPDELDEALKNRAYEIGVTLQEEVDVGAFLDEFYAGKLSKRDPSRLLGSDFECDVVLKFNPSQASFEFWHFKILLQRFKKYLRTRNMIKVIPMAGSQPQSEPQSPKLIRKSSRSRVATDPVSNGMRQRDTAAMQRAFARLPVNDREVLAMKEVAQMSYEEVATRLGDCKVNVRSRVSRARRRLKDLYLEEL